MKWYFAWPLLIVFGIGFWVLLDVFKATPGGSSLWKLEPGAFIGLAIWLLACWAGMIIGSYR